MAKVQSRRTISFNVDLFELIQQPAPMSGASNPAARLTADQVTEIRALAPSSTNKELAKRFGVAPTTISAVVRGVTWRNHG